MLFLTTVFICNNVYSQKAQLWTDADRKFLVDNLERTKLEIMRETQNLTSAQWSFKEDSTRWSIGQVLEHLGLYERIFAQEEISEKLFISVPTLNTHRKSLLEKFEVKNTAALIGKAIKSGIL